MRELKQSVVRVIVYWGLRIWWVNVGEVSNVWRVVSRDRYLNCFGCTDCVSCIIFSRQDGRGNTWELEVFVWACLTPYSTSFFILSEHYALTLLLRFSWRQGYAPSGLGWRGGRMFVWIVAFITAARWFAFCSRVLGYVARCLSLCRSLKGTLCCLVSQSIAEGIFNHTSFRWYGGMAIVFHGVRTRLFWCPCYIKTSWLGRDSIPTKFAIR